LTEKSHPHEFVEVFFPFRKNTKKSLNGGTEKISKKNRRTHFEFRRDLAMAWINEEYFKSYKEGKRKLNYAFGEDSGCHLSLSTPP